MSGLDAASEPPPPLVAKLSGSQAAPPAAARCHSGHDRPHSTCPSTLPHRGPTFGPLMAARISQSQSQAPRVDREDAARHHGGTPGPREPEIPVILWLRQTSLRALGGLTVPGTRAGGETGTPSRRIITETATARLARTLRVQNTRPASSQQLPRPRPRRP